MVRTHMPHWDAMPRRNPLGRYHFGVADTCANCGQFKPVYNVARGWCEACNKENQRQRRKEKQANVVTHEISKRAHDEKKSRRIKYAAWLNLMDDFGFSADDKQRGKDLVRPYLRAIEEDLTEEGEFDIEEPEAPDIGLDNRTQDTKGEAQDNRTQDNREPHDGPGTETDRTRDTKTAPGNETQDTAAGGPVSSTGASVEAEPDDSWLRLFTEKGE